MTNLDDFDPPERPDFRRVGRGKVPFVLDRNGKRVRFGRSSNAGKILDDESNLTDWKLRTVAAGAAQRPELMAKASVLDVDLNKKELREIAEECLVAGKGQRRAIIGTAVHAMFDHLDRQDGWTPPPNFLGICDAYEEFLANWGLEVVGIELHCINDEHRLAGTLDRRYRTTKTLVAPDGTIIPIGSVLVADHKTGKELEYSAGSYCTQLAAYVDSMHYNVLTDEREEWDPPNVPDWALIVHADSAGTEVNVYWVDIQQGREGLDLADRVKGWRRKDGLLTRAGNRTVTPAQIEAVEAAVDRADPIPAPIPATGPVTAVLRPPDGPGDPDRASYLRGRARAVLDHSTVAAKALQRAWPPGVPGLKASGHSEAQLDGIESALEYVEREHSVPFYPPFRAIEVEQSKSRHPSSGNPPVDTKYEVEVGNVSFFVQGHPRELVMTEWLMWAGETMEPGLSDVEGIANVVQAFGGLYPDECSNEDLMTLMDGCLRAVGLQGGRDLGLLTRQLTIKVLTLHSALTNGSAALMFDESGNPVVRVIK